MSVNGRDKIRVLAAVQCRDGGKAVQLNQHAGAGIDFGYPWHICGEPVH